MNLSEIGVIVEMCWRKIPKHFEGVRSDIFQVMPNHIHGIIEIPDSSILSHVGVEYIQPQQSLLVEMPRYQHVVPNSLGSIIRSFKAAVTRKVHGRFGTAPEVIWQRNYYDRIIRDDTEYFFTEQYIDLNPLMWELDTDYPTRRRPSIEELRKTLERDHQMNGQMLEDFIEHEVLYREWLRRGFTREDRLG